jgi:hypothetical protein
MAYKITVSLETTDAYQRDQILDDTIDLLDTYATTARKVAIVDETKTLHGKFGTNGSLTFDPGESAELSELGDIIKVTPMDRAMRTMEELRPKAGSGVEYVEISGGGHTTRLEPR